MNCLRLDKALWLLLVFVSGLAGPIVANPVISEFLAINGSGLEDEDGEASDWIELHNPTDRVLNLGGYFLTDNAEVLEKWRIPPVSLDPDNYLVVFASGKDRAAGAQWHTNFKLDGDGEYLALVAPDGRTVVSGFGPEYPKQFGDVSYGLGVVSGLVVTSTPVRAGHRARYFVPRAGEPEGGAGWRLPGYDDASWSAGESPFGFGYPDQPIGSGGDLGGVMHNQSELLFHGGVYLRYPFDLERPEDVIGMTLRIAADDGFVAYLNGEPVAAENAPSPAVFDSLANQPVDVAANESFPEFVLSFGGQLVRGENLLAIHGLNATHDDGDFLIYPELEVRSRDSDPGLRDGYFEMPTPGAGNGRALAGFIKDTKFSVDRGFYDQPFEVEITTETPGAEIRYTTDGSEPTADHGTTYTEPIAIGRTTVLQAAAFAQGMRPTNVDTQTYLFTEGIARQRNTGGIYWDTEMDPNVVNNPGATTVAEGLAAIPALSIVMDPDDLFGPQGIYSNATQRASDNPIWARKCSAEYFFHPDYDGPFRVQDGFQIDCGIQINGNFSRLSHNPKHSFRLKFKSEYGPAKLDFPVFPDSPVDEYDTLVIRTGHNQGWATGHASTQMLRNQYARDIQGYDPRQIVADGNHIHLFLNGQYWGLYNFHERPDDSFAAEHWGGPKQDYDGFKGLRAGGASQARILSGDRRAWTAMFSLADRDMLDARNYRAVLDFVDVDQLIDYTIGILYTGDRDGPTGIYPPAELPKNFYAIRRRNEDGRFRFFRWDSEFIFENIHTDMSERGGPENPAGLHKRLRRSPEYRLRFADRVHKHFFNGGAFTPENQKADYLSRAEQISDAMVAESARWGDAKREPPFTRDQNWAGERDRIVDSWMPGRHDIIINQFRADGLYPDLDAPSFIVNGSRLAGGPVPAGASLRMRSPGGTVYYTLDGSDPRLPDTPVEFTQYELVAEDAPKRAIMPSDPSVDHIWVDPGFDDTGWDAGTKGAGYELGDGFEAFIDPALNFATEQDPLENEAVYMRIAFDVADPSILDTLTLLMRYDDGFVAYLNGVEVARDRAPGPVDGPIMFAEGATETHDDELAVEFQSFPIDDYLPLLQAGRNVLAVAGLNSGASSSDFLLWPMLEAKDIQSGVLGNVPSPTAQEYTSAIALESSGTVKARTVDRGEWSALMEATYFVDSEPASASNLVISELHYHPSAPSEEEEAEDYDKRKDFEYVELLNVGPRTVDLTGLRFTEGVRFDFDRRSAVKYLEPGQRLLVVKNREAFLFRNPDVDSDLIAGEYGLRFSDDGEEVAMHRDDEEVLRFIYNDVKGWPRSADGDGPSLVLANPLSRPDPNLEANWRPSVAAGGSPGGADGESLAAWLAARDLSDPHGDPDGNGITNLMSYAFGGEIPPVIEVRALEVDGQLDDYLTLTYFRNGAAEDLEVISESSLDLVNWSALEVVPVSTEWQENAVARVTVRTAAPLRDHEARFVRLHIRM